MEHIPRIAGRDEASTFSLLTAGSVWMGIFEDKAEAVHGGEGRGGLGRGKGYLLHMTKDEGGAWWLVGSTLADEVSAQDRDKRLNSASEMMEKTAGHRSRVTLPHS